ncbi:MAG: type III PLP-dependent enzyme [Proteobacteria bacterium]|nr:type III PLP-dependent enzyme [Pseudomonadota bacterium]
MDPFQPEHIRRLVGRFGSPLLILDCQRVRSQWRRLARALPGVALHYALKPLPHPALVATILQEGGGLDLASTGEVQLARRLGAPPARCIHTHPIKRPVDIENALLFGVRTFVADNPDEILKFADFAGRARLLLRVAFRSATAVVDLSRKFGCEPADVPDLARLAQRLGVEVRGLSFHAGSQAADATRHVEAVQECARLMAAARRAQLGRFDMLDIGGGFPIDYLQPVPPIGRFCAPLRRALAQLPRGVQVIAEPGRYVCGPAAIAVAQVVGQAQREGSRWYYLDDGLYGSYSGQMFDHVRYRIESLRPGTRRFPSVLAGPTCDSFDVIAEGIELPRLNNGDLVVGHAMGAYTSACATNFNFIPRATVVTVNAHPRDTGSVTPWPAAPRPPRLP